MAMAGETEPKITIKSRQNSKDGIHSPMTVNTKINNSFDRRGNQYWTPQISRRNFSFPESAESMPLFSQRPTPSEIETQAQINRAFSTNDLLQSDLQDRQKTENRNRCGTGPLARPNAPRNYEAIPIYQVDRLALIFNRYEFNQKLVKQYKSKSGKNFGSKPKTPGSRPIASSIVEFFRKFKEKPPKKEALSSDREVGRTINLDKSQ